MRVLAIDTSGDVGAVALTEDGALRAAIQARVAHRHGETLLPHVERVLALASCRIEDVELLAVGLGPGSFTGLRIGIATAKGLALATRRPMVGVASSRVLARAALGALRLVAIDAKKDEVFVAAYEALGDGRLEVIFEAEHASPEGAAARLRGVLDRAPSASLVGSALDAHAAIFEAALPRVVRMPRAFFAPNAALLALEAEEALAARGPDDAARLAPSYVRDADAKLPG